MERLTQGAFAALAGVSRQAISRQVKAGNVIRTSEGIDPNHPVNLVYLQAHGKESRRSKPETLGQEALAEAKRGPRQPSKNTGKTDEDYADLADDAATGKDLDNKLKAVKLQKDRLDYFLKTKQSIPASQVHRVLARIGAILEENFRTFADRNGEELYSIAQADAGLEKFCLKISAEIDKGIKSVIKTTTKEMEKMRRDEGGIPGHPNQTRMDV
jgi:hypothetical protein